MVGLTRFVNPRPQLAAIARLRWQLFANSLRTLRGQLEVVARILMMLVFTVWGLGGALGMGTLGYALIAHRRTEDIAAILWVVLLFWQFFPLLAAPFTDIVDVSNFLLFPLTYSSYFLIRLAYGSLEPATFVGILWLFGILAGITVADSQLVFWSASLLLTFAIVNILMARMVLVWLERWLAERRTREILSIVFLLTLLGVQLVPPMVRHLSGRNRPEVRRTLEPLLPLERLLPPGLVGLSLAQARQGNSRSAMADLGLLSLYGAVFFVLLHLRLHAQYCGESLCEMAVIRTPPAAARAIAPGWAVPGLSGPLAAILEKETHYLWRSGPMLYTLLGPVFILLILRVTPARSNLGFSWRTSDLVFPLGTAYAILTLTNLVYNVFGGDAAGVQLFFSSPVRLRQVFIAKNLADAGVLGGEIVLVWLATCWLYRPPGFSITLATLAGVLFMLPLDMTIGNLLSVSAPRRIRFGSLGQQRIPGATQFAALGSQFAMFALAALVLMAARRHGKVWLATMCFLILAAAAFVAYRGMLRYAEKMALDRREILLGELSRT